MNHTTIAVDLAKDVIEVAIANQAGKIQQRHRLSRTGFSKLLHTEATAEVVMEACGSAHHWSRLAQGCGHQVRLLPAQYVAPYRRRNKTDRADCNAIVQAARDPEILSVPTKSVEQQSLQAIHRFRSNWMQTRTARINSLRGWFRELGIAIPVGAKKAIAAFPELIDDERTPVWIRPQLQALLAEIHTLEEQIPCCEQQLAAAAKQNDDIQRLEQVSGIGLLTASAIVASAGNAEYFRNGRHFSAWMGLTPKETSSGTTRRLGPISKRGDGYVRMLLIQGARSVLMSAIKKHKAGQPLNKLQRWAMQRYEHSHFNKAAVAVANKLARIAWATWHHQRDFDGDYIPA